MKKLIIIAFALIVGVFVSGFAGRVQAGAAVAPASATQAQIVKPGAIPVWYRRYYRRHYYRYYYRPYYRHYRYYRRRRCCW